MKIPEIIAIDGPAASGKSTAGRLLAERFGYLYFDTGVLYRAVTWSALQNGVAVDDEEGIVQLAKEAHIDVQPPSKDDGRAYDVYLDGVDVTWSIRRPEVDATVSVVSAYPGVREILSAQQRRIGLRGRVVMVGRDIGTVVFPEAEVKFYLVASVEERARRRYDELTARGEEASLEAITQSMRRRDRLDSSRAVAPLKPAEDAVIIKTDHLTIKEVLDQMERLLVEKAGRLTSKEQS
jgi:cytidylate kinase